jgi:hypothetical protein
LVNVGTELAAPAVPVLADSTGGELAGLLLIPAPDGDGCGASVSLVVDWQATPTPQTSTTPQSHRPK